MLIYTSIVLIFFLIAARLNINIEDISELIRQNKNVIFGFDNTIYFKITLVFFIFTIIWTFFLGIGIPLFLFTAFFYDVFFGTIILVTARSLGSTSMYFILKKFFYKDIKNYINQKKFLNKKLFDYIKKNDFKFFLFVRFIPGVPYQIPDLLPVIFNMKIRSYFLSKYLGSFFSNLIIINICSEFYKEIDLKYNNNVSEVNLNLILSIILFFLIIYYGLKFKKKIF